MYIDWGDVMMGIVAILLIGVIGFISGNIYDSFYIKPIASETANTYCKALGFDFYESFSRLGFFSKTPIAIKCKYVDQYRNVDLNIN